MGWFAHEGCVFAPVQARRPMVFYFGDDAHNEYIFKFVTRAVGLLSPMRNERIAMDYGPCRWPASTPTTAANGFGHIIRWREDNDDRASTHFTRDLSMLSGSEENSANPAADASAKPGPGGIHASPDGLWFDPAGLLWIRTDMSGSRLRSGPFGNHAMLVVNTETGDIRRFLLGPPGCEVSAAISTPDLRTLFVSILHPVDGSHWPDGNGARPRSATVIVTKDDGGIIGS